MTRRPRANTLRREIAREGEKLARARERLAALEAGGSPERPIEVVSASVVEAHARSMRCPTCDASLRVEEHAAVAHGEARLRVVTASCAQCGRRRAIWFRIAPALPS